MSTGSCSPGNVLESSCSVEFQRESSIVEVQQTDVANTSQQSSEIIELERYLSDLLKGLHKQQETQKNEVLQLILQQHQNVQGNFHTKPPALSINTIPVSSTAWTFTQGLILGQLSVIILIVAFIKFFVFTEAAPTQASSLPSKSSVSIIKTKKNDEIDISHLQTAPLSRLSTKDAVLFNGESISYQEEGIGLAEYDNMRLNYNKTLNSILEKTYYDVKTHTPESLDWFNVLVAQIISQARLEALNEGNIYESLNKALNSPIVLQYFDTMKITEINIGDDYPIFSNCRVKNNDGRLEAKIDVDMSDTITLGVQTNLLINQPKLMSASLPIKLSISVVRFSACLSVSLIATDDDDKTDNGNGNLNSTMGKSKTKEPHVSETSNTAANSKTKKTGSGGTTETANVGNNEAENKNTDGDIDKDGKGGHAIALMFSFSPDFRLEFEIKSLIGSRAKLENIPRISSILENVIRKWFIERCIEPRFQLIRLPSMWPRSKNTRQSMSTDQH